jgi:hypothetical protein
MKVIMVGRFVSDAHKVMTGCVLVELVLVFAGMDRTVTFKSLLWNLFAIS